MLRFPTLLLHINAQKIFPLVFTSWLWESFLVLYLCLLRTVASEVVMYIFWWVFWFFSCLVLGFIFCIILFFLYFFVFFSILRIFLYFLCFSITVYVYFCFARLEELMLVLTIIDERDFRQYFHFFAKLFLMKDFVFSVISTFFDVFGRASIYLMISVESVSTYLFSLVFLRFYFFENRYLLFLSH